jgi:hypothetical protein
MECVNSLTTSKGFVETNLPLRGRPGVPEIIILTTIGQWNKYPQSIFMFPI